MTDFPALPPGFQIVNDTPALPPGFVLATDVGKTAEPMSAWDRFKQGLRDPVDAGAQLLTKSLPDGVVSGVNKATAAVNNMPLIGPLTKALGMTPATPQQIDQGITQREKDYRPPEGVDWARMGGQTAATLPLAYAMPAGATLPRAIGMGAASGAATGALQPVANVGDPTLSNLVTGDMPADFWGQKGKQVGIGALTGGVAAPVFRGAARIISPEMSAPVRKLLDEGVTPSPGQILGGVFQRTEDKLTSVPILGDAINASRRSAMEGLNKAVYGRALNPIAGQVPKDVGREAVADVSTQLSNAYESLLPKMAFNADQQFMAEVGKVSQMAATLPEAQANRFEQLIKTQLFDKLTPAGLANGTKLKEIESQLGKFSRGYGKSPDFDQQQLGDALQEVQAAMRRGLERSNPQHAAELQKINQGYSAYATLRRAAAAQGSADGVFTPAQLSQAVKANDFSVAKGNYARGTARMQDLSDAGKQVLGSTYPDSGSIGRLLLGGGALGSYAINPHIPLGLAAASLPYLPIGRQITAGLLARRPDVAQPIAEGVRRLPAGLLAPALYPALGM